MSTTQALTLASDAPPGVSILRKLHAVMQECDYIQKDKENAFHRYRYASEAAIKEKLHAALVAHGIIPQFSIIGLTEREITRIKDGKPQTSEWLTTANIHYKFSCIDTGEFVEGTFFGCGVDPSDKGLYKAVTGAIKYILTSQFLIATGDDPEDDAGRTSTKAEKIGKQKEYLASRGIDPTIPPTHQSNQPPLTRPETIRELSATLDQPPASRTIEMRHAAQVAEAADVLKDVDKPKKAKPAPVGGVSFSALSHFKEVKALLREVTGVDTEYYRILGEAGYKKSNEIKDDAEARRIWKLLATEHSRLKQSAELTAILAQGSEIIGARAFADLLGVHGCLGVADVLALAGDPLAALLAELKDRVDQRKGGV